MKIPTRLENVMAKKIIVVFVLLIVASGMITSTGAAEDVHPPAPEGYPKSIAYPWVILGDFFDEPGISLNGDTS